MAKTIAMILGILLVAGIIAGIVVRKDYEGQIRAEKATSDSLRNSISVVEDSVKELRAARKRTEARLDSVKAADSTKTARLTAEADSLEGLVLRMVPDTAISAVKSLVAKKDSVIASKNKVIAQQNVTIDTLRAEIAQIARLTARKDSLIDWQAERIGYWREETKKAAMKGQFQLVSGRTLIDILIALGAYGLGRATS